ncbi:hypothetical protein JL720_16625 [Aureococcus anophagefferens]|nr:hypothetical protein JL720_16625 [Aureococcus anophagefferens]
MAERVTVAEAILDALREEDWGGAWLEAQTLDAGVVEASALVADPRVGHVHITGSEAAAVERRSARGQGAVAISAELGCATPWLVPRASGPPGSGERRVRARRGQEGERRLELPEPRSRAGGGWRRAFLDEVAAQIAAQPTWKAYYPGAAGRARRVASLRPGAPRRRSSGVALLGVGVAAPGFDGSALSKEVFGPLLAVCALPGGAAAGPWLRDQAVPFANSDAVPAR